MLNLVSAAAETSRVNKLRGGAAPARPYFCEVSGRRRPGNSGHSTGEVAEVSLEA